MSNYIKPGIIDVNPTMLKPILFTTYKPITKYILDITYEDSTTKQIELVEGDKNRPYKVVFKKEGKLVTAVGVPKIYRITECNKFCDFVNRVMDSEDLLIELDCSSEYSCTKVKFYLKDLRDIEDLNPNGCECGCSGDCNCSDMAPKFRIYLNNFDCKTKIRCLVDDDLEAYLEACITKLGEALLVEEYTDFDVYVFDEDNKINIYKYDEHGKFVVSVTEDLLETEVKLLIKYYVNEIEHPVYDEFTIIPFKKSLDDDGKVLTKAVTTQDRQYLGDGLKPALGTGLTPGYKQYRNSKNYSNSVIE